MSGVEPVSTRNRAAETYPIHAYIARTGDLTGSTAGLFFGRGLIRTVVCIGKTGFIRTHNGGANAAEKTYEKGEKTWQAPTRT